MRKPPRERMLDREHRLRRGSEFQYMKRTGRRFVGRYCLLVTAPAQDGIFRFGIITSRRFSSKAVVRNRARRLLRESLRRAAPQLAPSWILLIPRFPIRDRRLADVEQEVERLAAKAGLLRRSPGEEQTEQQL